MPRKWAGELAAGRKAGGRSPGIHRVCDQRTHERGAAGAILAVPEEAWKPYGEPHPEEIRECAEVPFVPGEKSEHKRTEPLRYVGIRIRKRQGGLFEGGPATRHFALVSNIWDWKAGRLIEWHREKAGTIEAVHEVVKNELAGGVLPSKYFGANAAWLRLK